MISKIKILLKNPGFLFQYSNRMKRLEKILHSDQNTIKSYFDESEVCWSYVENKMKNIENSVRIGHERLQLLYTCVRILKPKVMVETGVAGGSTSFTILSAMKKNGFGNLYSIDIDNSQYDNQRSIHGAGGHSPDALNTALVASWVHSRSKRFNTL